MADCVRDCQPHAVLQGSFYVKSEPAQFVVEVQGFIHKNNALQGWRQHQNQCIGRRGGKEVTHPTRRPAAPESTVSEGGGGDRGGVVRIQCDYSMRRQRRHTSEKQPKQFESIRL